ncbi:MAG: carboxylesterase family protein, partial [Thermoanaerobaculia bacterium]|nr:carboxylesterase family protein [Thermoanaerobaculia bacterium]
AGEHNHVPVLVGSTADEGSALFPAAEPTREAYEAQVRSQLGPGADAILAAYADVAASSPRRAAAEIRSDRIFALPMRTWARLVERGGNDAFLYYFSQVPPVFLLYLPGRELEGEPAANRDYGAYHSGDLAYVFDNVGRVGSGWSDGDIALAEAMSTYWTHFARHGDPNGDGVPPWPRYEAASDQALELGPEIRIIRGLRRAHLDAWDAVQPIVTE